MTLDEFVEQERNRLEAFRLAWLKANSTHPNSFPLKMPEGDEGLWDESLSDFDGEDFDLEGIDDEENACEPETVMCGGCGNSDPEVRCLGCLHDFGDPSSAWVRELQEETANG